MVKTSDKQLSTRLYEGYVLGLPRWLSHGAAMNAPRSFLHATIKRVFDLVYRCLTRRGPRNTLDKTLRE